MAHSNAAPPTAPDALIRAPMRVAGLLALAAAAALWLGVLGWSAWLTAQYGVICGLDGHGLTAPHCAACYVAVGLAVVGVALLAGSREDERVSNPASAPIKRQSGPTSELRPR